MIPNAYLYYYYHREQAVENILKSQRTRGEIIREINERMLKELSVMDIEKDFKSMLQTYLHHYSMRESSYMSILCSNVQDALDIISEYVEYAVITLGKEGCLAKYEGKSMQVPPIKNIQAVDTTGAGDNFLAGLIYGMYQDWSFFECLKMGNAVGAYSTTGLGCCKSVITIDKAMELMSQINM